MENKRAIKIDKRIIKTRNKLIAGFSKLLESKNIKEIKVSELTDISNVNRATFYLHYNDIDDFLIQTENMLSEEFTAIFVPRDMHINDNGEIPSIQALFDFISDNATLMKALLGKHGDPEFSYKLAYIARCNMIEEFMSDNEKNVAEYYSIYYIINGMIGVIFKWIDGGLKEPPEVMSSILIEFLSRGTKLITK